jgi:Phospholipase_D-nuclease N-terminal
MTMPRDGSGISMARVGSREKEAACSCGHRSRSVRSFLTVLEIALLATWIWVAISVISDVYRSPDLSSAAKAGWLFVIVLIPLLGVMLYVNARGDRMSEHEVGGEHQLEDPRNRGVLTDDEFQRAGARRARRTKASEADDIAALEDLREEAYRRRIRARQGEGGRLVIV